MVISCFVSLENLCLFTSYSPFFSPSSLHQELCLYTLGNLCPENELVREKLLAQGIIPALHHCLQVNSDSYLNTHIHTHATYFSSSPLSHIFKVLIQIILNKNDIILKLGMDILLNCNSIIALYLNFLFPVIEAIF